jgi:hypothetical protein
MILTLKSVISILPTVVSNAALKKYFLTFLFLQFTLSLKAVTLTLDPAKCADTLTVSYPQDEKPLDTIDFDVKSVWKMLSEVSNFEFPNTETQPETLNKKIEQTLTTVKSLISTAIPSNDSDVIEDIAQTLARNFDKIFNMSRWLSAQASSTPINSNLKKEVHFSTFIEVSDFLKLKANPVVISILADQFWNSLKQYSSHPSTEQKILLAYMESLIIQMGIDAEYFFLTDIDHASKEIQKAYFAWKNIKQRNYNPNEPIFSFDAYLTIIHDKIRTKTRKKAMRSHRAKHPLSLDLDFLGTPVVKDKDGIDTHDVFPILDMIYDFKSFMKFFPDHQSVEVEAGLNPMETMLNFLKYFYEKVEDAQATENAHFEYFYSGQKNIIPRNFEKKYQKKYKTLLEITFVLEMVIEWYLKNQQLTTIMSREDFIDKLSYFGDAINILLIENQNPQIRSFLRDVDSYILGLADSPE